MDAASGKASEIAAKRVNRKQLLSSLSKKQGALENSRLGKLLPNDFAEPDTREEDEAVIANAQPLMLLGKILSSLCVNSLVSYFLISWRLHNQLTTKPHDILPLTPGNTCVFYSLSSALLCFTAFVRPNSSGLMCQRNFPTVLRASPITKRR